MKKIVLLILMSILFTGCSIKEVDNKDINKTIDTILYKDTALANISYNGYKYYLPKGVSIIDNISYNNKLVSDKNVYYLYIDIVSYSYQKETSYEIDSKAYYSKQLKYKNKNGYLEINKIDDKYFIEMMYNYAKIETYVDKRDIPDTVINLSYILSSIKFNDKVIKTLFDKNILSYGEEKFEILKPKGKTGNVIDFVNEDTSDMQQTDEDIIISDESKNKVE